ncbi:MAG: T9SS type A sorting domain-containing protein [Ignavibacteriae bacterium]|nr:T9SS type A sorting domain-containing protein [Ignavibacteriota bacterium]
MKKFIFIPFLMLFAINVFSMQDSTSSISEFSARLKKGKIYLHWKINYKTELNRIRIEVKSPNENAFRYLDEIAAENYSKKITAESETTSEYDYTYKPDINGVYIFRIRLNDKNFRTISESEIKIGVSDITEFNLFQNSPNPFNPTTSISYELFTAAKVTLKVYSLDGKEIETLVDEFQQPGKFKVDFSAGKNSELSSGIYFYKLRTNHSSDIKKMIFTK